MADLDKAALDRWLTTEPEPYDVDEDDQPCPTCGLAYEQHHEGHVDRDGDDYDVMLCAPEGCREGARLRHFVKTGCCDLMPALAPKPGATWATDRTTLYCEGCGDELEILA